METQLNIKKGNLITKALFDDAENCFKINCLRLRLRLINLTVLRVDLSVETFKCWTFKYESLLDKIILTLC